MSDQFTVDYFIEKFESIPEEKWCVRDFVYGDQCCALGHCGRTMEYRTEEDQALEFLFDGIGLIVTFVNDGLAYDFPQPTPKQRILAALLEIKGRQS